MKDRLAHFTLSPILVFLFICFSPHLLFADQINLSFDLCATPASFSIDSPSAIAFDDEENLYVVNTSANKVLVYNTDGILLDTLSGLSKPVSLAVDLDGSIFVGNANGDARNVEVYDTNLDFMFKLGTGDGEFTQPTAIAVSDSSGKIYVVDHKEDIVKVFLPDGSYDFAFGESGSEQGQFNSPTSIAIQNNRVFVTDLEVIIEPDSPPHEGARVQVFTLDGDFVSSYGSYGQGSGKMIKPLGIAVDSNNIAYVADSYQNVVQAFDSDGTFLATAFHLEQPMRTPVDVAMGPVSERLYVAALNSSRVDIFCPVVTIHESVTFDVSTSVVGAGGSLAVDSITVGADESRVFAVEDQQNITFSIAAVQENGYHIDKLLVDGVDVLAAADTTIVESNSQDYPVTAQYTLSAVSAAHSVEAFFVLNSYTVAVTATSSPENCGQITPAGPVMVTHGNDQEFVLSYNADDCLYTDLLIDGVSVGTPASYTFSAVSDDHTLEAVFGALSYQIEVSSSNTAHGMSYPSGTIVADQGTDHTVYCYPFGVYQLDGILIDNTTLVTENSYTFVNVTADHTARCEFSPITHTLAATVSAGSQGCTITPAGTTTVSEGADQTYIVSVDEGYIVGDLIIDGVSVGSYQSYTFYYIIADHNLEVSCSADFTNTVPVAEAGPDQNSGCQAAVTVVGENSYDNDEGDTLTFFWEQTSGTSVTLSDPTVANPTFTAPSCNPGDDTESLRFQLTVTDSYGAAASDACLVNVGWQNVPPEADAGFDQNVEENDLVILDGTGSEDSDGVIVSYLWQQTKGKTVSLSSDAVADPDFVAPDLDSGSETEQLIFKLTVTDDYGALAEDECVINVSFINEPPVAKANCPAEAVKAGDIVSLGGTESTDADGDIASYQWRQATTDGTVPVVFSSTKTADTSFVAPEAGFEDAILSFELTVTDFDGGKATETCTVTLKGEDDTDSDNDGLPDSLEDDSCTDAHNADTDGDGITDGSEDANHNGMVDDGENDPCEFDNRAPFANAGIDQTVYSESTVSLDGFGSWDPNNNIVSYSWKQTAGAVVELSGVQTASPTFIAPLVGKTNEILHFELTVRDAHGLEAKDSCAVIVMPAPQALQVHIEKTTKLRIKTEQLIQKTEKLTKELEKLEEYHSNHRFMWRIKRYGNKYRKISRQYRRTQKEYQDTVQDYEEQLDKVNSYK
ncbi:MAG: hypothetical protein KQH63_03355 [Desulfobulbaceae bacterium]|nr:hypothetical protein [Desulfobulbaceae bacterium]